MKPAALALAFGLSCAHTSLEQPADHSPTDHEADADAERYAAARLIVDACTDAPTTESRIALVYFVMEHCRAPEATCRRRACKAIAREACPKRHTVEVHDVDL